MEEFIKILKDAIFDHNDIRNWVLLVIIIGIAAISYLKEVALAEDIEKIKSELSKREVKFTRHAEMQIECLKTMYDILVSYHYEFDKLIYPRKATIDNFKEQVKYSRRTFSELIMYCQRNRILLTDEIVLQSKVVQRKFNEHNAFIEIEEKAISTLEELNGTRDERYLYGSAEAEAVANHLKCISDGFDITAYEAEIQKLREIIETYFKNLVE